MQSFAKNGGGLYMGMGEVYHDLSGVWKCDASVAQQWRKITYYSMDAIGSFRKSIIGTSSGLQFEASCPVNRWMCH